RERYPLVSLVLEEAGTSELIDGLRAERVDAAFIRSPVADPAGLIVHPLLEEEMVVALPAGHVLAPPATGADEQALPLADLAAETFILYRRPLGPGLYDAIIAACHGASFSPLVGQEAPRVLSTLNLVAAGLGVSIVPASLRRLHMDGIVYRRLHEGAGLGAPIDLAYRTEEGSAAVRRFA